MSELGQRGFILTDAFANKITATAVSIADHKPYAQSQFDWRIDLVRLGSVLLKIVNILSPLIIAIALSPWQKMGATPTRRWR